MAITPIRSNHANLLRDATPNVNLFQRALTGVQQRSEGSGGDRPDYRLATDNEEWGDPRDIEIVEVPAGALGDDYVGDVLAFKRDGEIVVVKNTVNPGLFGFIESLSEIDPDIMAGLRHDPDINIIRNNETIALKDIHPETIMIADSGDGVARAWVQMNNGDEFFILPQLTPDLYGKVKAMDDGWDTGMGLDPIEKDKADWDIVYDDEALSAADLADAEISPPDEEFGFIRVEMKDGERLNISRDITPGLYSRASGEYRLEREDEIGEEIDTSRTAAGLPTATSLELASMETSETGEDDEKLTVEQLTWKTVMEDWKEGIDSGEIKEDDDRAQLYRAIQAQTIASNGTSMAALDISLGWNTQEAIGKDFDPIVDQEAAAARIVELMPSETVQKDVRAAFDAALGKAEGGHERAADLKKRAMSTEYMDYIEDLTKDGKKEIAQYDIAATHLELSRIDPALADEFRVTVIGQGLGRELDNILGAPEEISSESVEGAAADVLSWMLTLAKDGLFGLAQRSTESQQFIKEILGNKKSTEEFGRAMQELGAILTEKGEITEADVDRLLGNGKYTSFSEMSSGSARKFLGDLNDAGVLGVAGGFLSLTAGVYELVKQGGDGQIGATVEDQLTLAKEFVGFIGAFKDADKVFGNVAKIWTGTSLHEAFPLESPFHELFGRTSDNKGGGYQGTRNEAAAEFFDKLGEATDNLSSSKHQALFHNMSVEDYDKAVAGMQHGFKESVASDKSFTRRTTAAALNLIAIGAETFGGVADTALGAMAIKNGLEAGDKNSVAAGAIQVASGGTVILGSGASAAAHFLRGPAGTFLRSLSGPLFWVGAALQVVLTIPDIIADIQRTKAVEGHQDGLRDLMSGLEKDGLLKEGGLERYRFLDAYMENYGQRDAPEDVSIFEYRKDEYEHFVEEWRSRKLPEHQFTSTLFLDERNHKDYEGDGRNLPSRMDT